MRILKEPLFHFFLLGALIFVWFGVRNPDAMQEPSTDEIVFDAQDLGRVIEQFEATWRRPPTEQELERLLDGLVREEVMVREAKALGLDQNDGVIRSRLVQKMDFLTTSVAQAVSPDDAELMEHMEAFPDRFMAPAQISFEQVQLEAGDAGEAALSALQGGASPESVAPTTLLPTLVPLTVVRGVDAMFGKNFFNQLADLPLDEWVGPILSGYGPHAIKVAAYIPPVLPAFEDARSDVLHDWRREKREELSKAQFEAFKARYAIAMPDTAEVSEALAQ